jgi:hypothetical protein
MVTEKQNEKMLDAIENDKLNIKIKEKPCVTYSNTYFSATLEVNGIDVEITKTISWDENAGVNDTEIEIANEDDLDFTDGQIKEIKEYCDNMEWD